MRSHEDVLDHANEMLMEHGAAATARAQLEVDVCRVQGQTAEAAFWRRVVRALRTVDGADRLDRSALLH
ncbi:hypothetical protein [Desertibaculum subflavum]|uniref:hypothetical protein n=1 Tax=Desertibaculum subflavum TaxID=2268458 RepID=UPI000E66C7FA